MHLIWLGFFMCFHVHVVILNTDCVYSTFTFVYVNASQLTVLTVVTQVLT